MPFIKNISPALRILILILANTILFQLLSREWQNWNDSRIVQKQRFASMVDGLAEQTRVSNLIGETRACLNAAKQRLPNGDGYIWLTKLLTSRHSRMQIWVTPSERRAQQIIDLPNYCSSVFRVRGTGTVSELASLLATLEGEMPYAQVQDLLVQGLAIAHDRVEFSFSLVAALRPEKEEAL